ncbi:hypothetical protein [Pedobacter agri]|uniref:hypothetical protein n=1 Tax=Pedobacter agri TaxID=454586 RepID=UPI00292CB263|nr:hypothetical protein [Pedobacter agri]
MSKTYETGHAKNVANFETLVTILNGFGAAYNPSNANLQLGSLGQKAADARLATEQVNQLLAANNSAIAVREQAFEPLSKLSTRIFNAVKASGVPDVVVEQVTTHHRKLQGRRASAKLSEAEKQALAAKGTPANQVSASQLSFDSRLDTFDKLIKLLGTIPQYTPNEVELQLASLTTLYQDLLQQNREVISKNTDLSIARINRNTVCYDEETGMIALALNAKNYAKSVFGTTTPQYKQIAGITFRYIP